MMPGESIPMARAMTAGRVSIGVISALVGLCMFNQTFIAPSVKELIIDRFDATTAEASLFMTVEMVAYIIFAMVWGAASDKTGRRRPFIVAGFLGSSGLYFVMSLAPDLTTLLVIRFVQGAMTVMAWSLLMGLALDLVDRKEHGASMGIVGMGLALGLGFGAPVGGLLGTYGAVVPLYGASVLFLFGGVASTYVLSDVPITHKPESIVKSLRLAFGERTTLGPFLYSFAERFSAGFLVFLGPLFLADEFGLDPGERGLMLAAFLLPFALMQYPFGRLSDRMDRRVMLVISGLAYASVFAAVGAVESTSQMIAVLLVSGAFAAMLLPASLAIVGDIARKGDHATLMGGFNSFGSLGFAVSPITAAVLHDAVDHRVAFFMGAIIILGTIAVGSVFLRGIKPHTTGRERFRARGKAHRGK